MEKAYTKWKDNGINMNIGDRMYVALNQRNPLVTELVISSFERSFPIILILMRLQ